MRPFAFHEPASIDEAIALLEEHGDEADLIAGGTSVVLMLEQGLIDPGHLVSIARLQGLRGVDLGVDGALGIGALATHRDAAANPSMREGWPALAAAIASVATVRIRNQATLGGSVCHADPAQDPAVALLGLDARFVVRGPAGERVIAAADFFVDLFETSLAPDEILIRIEVPAADGRGMDYRKFLPGSHADYATVSVFASVRVDDDGCARDVRVSLGSVGSTPLRARTTEAALEGEVPTPERMREVAALVRGEIDPVGDTRGSAAYKLEMARVWTERALRSAIGSA